MTRCQLILVMILAALVAVVLGGALVRPAAFADGQVSTEPSAQEVRAQYQQKRMLSKQAYHFDQWPGKGGEVRPGVNAGRALAQVLPGIQCASASASREGSDYAPPNRSSVRWRTANVEVSIRLFVSCDDAQETMIDDLTFRTNPAISPRGSELGVDLGDVSFPGARATRFVRNNLLVTVRSRAGNTLELAELIDQAILARPAFDVYEEMAAYRPQIHELWFREKLSQPIPLVGMLSPGRRFPLVVDVSDPEGGPVYLSWSGKGASAQEAPAEKGFRYWARLGLEGPEGEVQQRELTLTAVNECGLFSTATLPIKVTVKRVKNTWADGAPVQE